MIVRAPAEGPMKAAISLADRRIVDARETPAHQAVFVELPILIAVGAKPVAAIVVPLIGEADRDAVFAETPQLLDEPIVQLALPLARQKADDRFAAPARTRRDCATDYRPYRRARPFQGRGCSMPSSAKRTFSIAASSCERGQRGTLRLPSMMISIGGKASAQLGIFALELGIDAHAAGGPPCAISCFGEARRDVLLAIPVEGLEPQPEDALRASLCSLAR